jgi:hypothetical protein
MKRSEFNRIVKEEIKKMSKMDMKEEQPAPKVASDVTALSKASKTIQSRTKNINTPQEFPGAFEVWFTSLGYEPGRVGKQFVKNEVEKILVKLGYK